MHISARLNRVFGVSATVVLTTLGAGIKPLPAQQAPIAISFDALEITLSGRVMTQFTTSTVDGENPAEFLLRRVRFGLDVEINDVVSGRIHPDYGRNRIGLGDAYMQLALSPSLALQAGRSHRPFGIIEQTTSLRIAPIERGVAIRGVDAFDLSDLLNELSYSDRDLGLRAVGSVPGVEGLSYLAGVFNGPSQGGVDDDLSLQYVARLEADPIDDLGLGVAWGRHDFFGSNGAGAVREAGNAWVADVEYGGRIPALGFHLVGQIATGAADPINEIDFTGGQAWVSYLVEGSGAVTRFEPLVRLSHVTIDEGGPLSGGTLVTPGFNIYVGGLNRLMFNYDIFSIDDGDTEGSFKAQFQLTF